MSEYADIENRFTFHPVKGPEQAKQYETTRGKCLDLAKYLVGTIPSSRERSLALTALEEVVMWANAAVARHSSEAE